LKVKHAAAIRIVMVAVVVAAVFVGGVLLTNRVVSEQRRNYFNQREVQVATAAASIDFKDVQALAGNASDLTNPAFQRLRSQLVRVKGSDPHVRYVYLMRPDSAGNKLMFLVDAEDPTSSEYSPPGQIYGETKPSELKAFNGKAGTDAVIEGPITDHWGTWISATAYVVDNSGKPVAALGTDVDVERALASVNQVHHLGIVFDILGCLLLALLGIQWVLWRYNRDRRLALREEMEHSIVHLNDQLVKADVMKSEFIQLASHELRGPVNAVNVAVQTMDKSLEPKLDQDERTLLHVARNGTRRLVDLVDNLLDLTRIEAGDLALKPQGYDPRTAVTMTAQLFEPLAAEKGLYLNTSVPDDPIDALIDPNALLRVLENLVSNAIKFTKTGGVEIHLERTNDLLAFSVKDTGLGIPMDFQPDVFKKFKKLHAPGGGGERGAGMGLALCKAMVEKMGGSVSFKSMPSGTTFFFEIPLKIAGDMRTSPDTNGA
jgi:signal transduction histidine kinase